jgi:hypothetical protein
MTIDRFIASMRLSQRSLMLCGDWNEPVRGDPFAVRGEPFTSLLGRPSEEACHLAGDRADIANAERSSERKWFSVVLAEELLGGTDDGGPIGWHALGDGGDGACG